MSSLSKVWDLTRSNQNKEINETQALWPLPPLPIQIPDAIASPLKSKAPKTVEDKASINKNW